jgi:hypothetical protein
MGRQATELLPMPNQGDSAPPFDEGCQDVLDEEIGHSGMAIMIATSIFEPGDSATAQKVDDIAILFKPRLFTRFGPGYRRRPPRLDAMLLDHIHYPHYKSVILIKAILLLYTSLDLLPMRME